MQCNLSPSFVTAPPPPKKNKDSHSQCKHHSAADISELIIAVERNKIQACHVFLISFSCLKYFSMFSWKRIIPLLK